MSKCPVVRPVASNLNKEIKVTATFTHTSSKGDGVKVMVYVGNKSYSVNIPHLGSKTISFNCDSESYLTIYGDGSGMGTAGETLSITSSDENMVPREKQIVSKGRYTLSVFSLPDTDTTITFRFY